MADTNKMPVSTNIEDRRGTVLYDNPASVKMYMAGPKTKNPYSPDFVKRYRAAYDKLNAAKTDEELKAALEGTKAIEAERSAFDQGGQ
jgi:hypothetical protein